MTELLLLLLQELLRGGTKPPGHYHWKVIRKLGATSSPQIASPPFPKHTQEHGGDAGTGESEEGRIERKGVSPFPKKAGNKLERGGWRSARAGCGFFKGGFLSGYKVCPSPQDYFFFKFYS